MNTFTYEKKILIAICTYKRPEKLVRLLNSLSNINCPDKTRTEILVVDNDIDQSAKIICANYNGKIPVRYINEVNKGLSNVRNRALSECIQLNADYIAFIDDDEIADKDWIKAKIGRASCRERV